MTPSIETPRLLLKPTELKHAEQVQRIFPVWEIVKYLNSVPWPYPADGAETFYRDVILPAMGRNEKWDWTIPLKTDPERIIGGIGLGIRKGKPRLLACASVAWKRADDGGV